VTVIATGFDRPSAAATAAVTDSKGAPVIPFPSARQRAGGVRPAGGLSPDVRRLPGPLPGLADKAGAQDLSDMEIPTFIRRQMD
jgi:hypothetical protein